MRDRVMSARNQRWYSAQRFGAYQNVATAMPNSLLPRRTGSMIPGRGGQNALQNGETLVCLHAQDFL